MVMRVGTGAVILCAALYVACGGVNMSDDKRTPPRSYATADDDGDDDDSEDAGGGSGDTDADTTSTVTPTEPTPQPEAGAPEPIPEGSFAAGTELETTANLNLRDGPGTSFNILATMPAATKVKVQTTSGADGWVHLDYQGMLGYGSKMFLVKP